ncbi:helix-turn-helix domain-containing protein [Neobacillus vireti]|uniref:helix-turn-helix domain-containing protein n=1 Tax=Neobacillus vireti TaxID=220686 RepID=UPI00300065A9
MANKFITLEKAKTEIKRLQYYVNLVETYEPINLEQEIVKEYAKTSSINEVSRRLNVSYETVVDVISSMGKDELHKLVRSGYMKKTKHSRTYSY